MSTTKRRQSKKKVEDDVAALQPTKAHSRKHSRSGREVERVKGKSKRTTDSHAVIHALDSEDEYADDAGSGNDHDETESDGNRSTSRTRNTTQSVTVMVPVGETLSRIEESLDEVKNMVAASSDSASITASRTAGELKSAIREIRRNLNSGGGGSGGDSAIQINALRADTTVLLELVRNLVSRQACAPVQLPTNSGDALNHALEDIKSRVERISRQDTYVDGLKQGVDEIREGVRSRARDLQDVAHKVDKHGEHIKSRLANIERYVQESASPSVSEVEMLAGIRNVGAIKQNVERLVSSSTDIKAEIAAVKNQQALASGISNTINDLKNELKAEIASVRIAHPPTDHEIKEPPTCIYDNLRDASNVKQTLADIKAELATSRRPDERLVEAVAELKMDLQHLRTTICAGGHAGEGQKTIETRLVNIKDIVKDIKEELKNAPARVATATVQVPVAASPSTQPQQPILVQSVPTDVVTEVVKSIKPLLKDIRKGVMGLYKVPAGVKSEGPSPSLDRTVADLAAAVAHLRNTPATAAPIVKAETIDLQPVLNATNTITGQLGGLSASIAHAQETHRDLKESGKDIKESVEQLKEVVRKQCGKSDTTKATFDDAAIMAKLNRITASLDEKVESADIKKLREELDAIGAALRNTPTASAEAISQVARTAEHVAQVADTQQALMDEVKKLLEQRQSVPAPATATAIPAGPVQNSLVAATDSDPVSTAKLNELARRLEELVAQSAPAAGVTMLDADSRDALTSLITNAARVVQTNSVPVPPAPAVTPADLQTIKSASTILGQVVAQRGAAVSAPADLGAVRTALTDIQNQVRALSAPQPNAAAPIVSAIADDATRLKNDLTTINDTLAVAVTTVSSSANAYQDIVNNIQKLQGTPVVELGQFMKTLEALLQQITLAEGAFGDAQVRALAAALDQLKAKVQAQIAAATDATAAVAQAATLEELVEKLTKVLGGLKNDVAKQALATVQGTRPTFDDRALADDIQQSVNTIATSGVRGLLGYIQNEDVLKRITASSDFTNAAQALVIAGANGAMRIAAEAPPAITGETRLAIEAAAADLATRNARAINEHYRTLLLNGGPATQDFDGARLILNQFVNNAARQIVDGVRDAVPLLAGPQAIALTGGSMVATSGGAVASPAARTAANDDPFRLERFRLTEDIETWRHESEYRWERLTKDKILRWGCLWDTNDMAPRTKLSASTVRQGHIDFVAQFSAGCPVLDIESCRFVCAVLRWPYMISSLNRRAEGGYDVDARKKATVDAIMAAAGRALVERAYAFANNQRVFERGGAMQQEREIKPGPRDILEVRPADAVNYLTDAAMLLARDPAMDAFAEPYFKQMRVLNAESANLEQLRITKDFDEVYRYLLERQRQTTPEHYAARELDDFKRSTAVIIISAVFESDLWWSAIGETDIAASRMLLRYMYRGCSPTAAAVDTFTAVCEQLAYYTVQPTAELADKGPFMPVQFTPVLYKSAIVPGDQNATQNNIRDASNPACISAALMGIVSAFDNVECRVGLSGLANLRLILEEHVEEEDEVAKFQAGGDAVQKRMARHNKIADRFAVAAASDDEDADSSNWLAFSCDTVVKGCVQLLMEQADKWATSKANETAMTDEVYTAELFKNYGLPLSRMQGFKRLTDPVDDFSRAVPYAAARMVLMCIAPKYYDFTLGVNSVHTKASFRPALLGSLRDAITGEMDVNASDLIAEVGTPQTDESFLLLDNAILHVQKMIFVSLYAGSYYMGGDAPRPTDGPIEGDIRIFHKLTVEPLSDAQKGVYGAVMPQLWLPYTADQASAAERMFDLRGQIVASMETALDFVMNHARRPRVYKAITNGTAAGAVVAVPPGGGGQLVITADNVAPLRLGGDEEPLVALASIKTIATFRTPTNVAWHIQRRDNFKKFIQDSNLVLDIERPTGVENDGYAKLEKLSFANTPRPTTTRAFNTDPDFALQLSYDGRPLMSVFVDRIVSVWSLPRYYRFVRPGPPASAKLTGEGAGAYVSISVHNFVGTELNYLVDLAVAMAALELDAGLGLDPAYLTAVKQPIRGIAFTKYLGSVYSVKGKAMRTIPNVATMDKVKAYARPDVQFQQAEEKNLNFKTLGLITRGLLKDATTHTLVLTMLAEKAREAGELFKAGHPAVAVPAVTADATVVAMAGADDDDEL